MPLLLVRTHVLTSVMSNIDYAVQRTNVARWKLSEMHMARANQLACCVLRYVGRRLQALRGRSFFCCVRTDNTHIYRRVGEATEICVREAN